ncbi:hypothetical protein M9H77_30630 [Catharanthus roseus]|uniref:Uncharacterized protein n=1 Tax=Catharanthus roseus TaxID=4058 RepID=A0ACB9ZXR9_CATRO|nr:hypothetical protein M9H77_30630 [Catharanthus roseus]
MKEHRNKVSKTPRFVKFLSKIPFLQILFKKKIKSETFETLKFMENYFYNLRTLFFERIVVLRHLNQTIEDELCHVQQAWERLEQQLSCLEKKETGSQPIKTWSLIKQALRNIFGVENREGQTQGQVKEKFMESLMGEKSTKVDETSQK